MIKVSEIKVNYAANPIGIEHVEQIGWILTSDKKNVVQKSYHIQIACDSEYKQLIFDSGIVFGEESANISFEDVDPKLTSSAKYFLRVKVRTNYDETSSWEEAFFVTALLSHKEWQAEFITAESEADKDNAKAHYLRKEVTIDKEVKSAYVHTTALGLYHFYINGAQIGNDEFTPGWTSYHKHLLYQTYDIKEYLKQGLNAFGAIVGAGWYKGKMGFVGLRNHYGNHGAFLCQAVVEYTDGTKEVICSNSTWKGIKSPITFSEIYDGEMYDARLEIEDWNMPGCDETHWKKTRSIPVEKNMLTAQYAAKVKVMTGVPAKRLFTTPNGDTVIDFGQNLTGWVTFRARGLSGDQIELNCFEVLDADGNVYTENLRSAKQTILYYCKDDKEVVFHPKFSFQGFQYVKVTSYPGEIKLENFTAYAVHSDMEQTSFFECSNKDINQLHHNILWGMKGNFLDVPTDCPQRDERLGWTGDAQIFCRTASFLMDTDVFYSKWLRDLKEDQTPAGGVPHVIPDILSGNSGNDRLMKDGTDSAAAWADAAVIIPWTMYLVYGDINIIKKQYESMKAWIHFMREHAVNGIWNYQLQFGDWVALDAEEGSYFGTTPNDLTCTAFYAYSTGLLAKMAAIIGEEADALSYQKLYEEIVSGYQEHFFDKNGHLTARTQTAQIVTLQFGLAPEEYKETVIKDLLELLEEENGHLVTGFVGTPYFCNVLSSNGHTKEAYDLLLKDDFPSWLYQVKMGATTIWEHWDGKKPDGSMWSPDMNSFNHYAYGAVGEWLYRVVAGIECDENEPAYKHIMISPHIGGNLDYVKASYKSVHGIIGVEWEKADERIILNIEIPCNTKATICLNDVRSIEKTSDLDFEQLGSQYKAQTGSGKYRIIYDSI